MFVYLKVLGFFGNSVRLVTLHSKKNQISLKGLNPHAMSFRLGCNGRRNLANQVQGHPKSYLTGMSRALKNSSHAPKLNVKISNFRGNGKLFRTS